MNHLHRSRDIVLLIVTVLLSSAAHAQLSIDSCYSKAMRNYPLVRQYDLIENSKDLNLSTVSKCWLPQASLSGRASWQSDITEFPDQFMNLINQLGIGGISFPDQDQYRVALEVTQAIWDGGATSAQRKRIEASAETERQSLEVNLYALKNQVNQLFFSILMLDEQLKQNDLFLDELQRNYDQVSSYIDNGLANQSDLNKVRVEQLSRRQAAAEMRASVKAYKLILSLFIGEEISDQTTLLKPQTSESLSEEINRPELHLFDAQNALLETQYGLLSAKVMPRVGLFAQGAYANPGLNLFDSGFTPYFIGGLQFSWNFGGFYSLKDDRNLLKTKQQTVDLNREAFLFNTQQKIAKQNTELEKYKELLANDDEIIALRSEIKESSMVKVENGTMSVNDYLQDLFAENMAKQTRVLHEMQWLLNVYQLKVESGN